MKHFNLYIVLVLPIIIAILSFISRYMMLIILLPTIEYLLLAWDQSCYEVEQRKRGETS